MPFSSRLRKAGVLLVVVILVGLSITFGLRKTVTLEIDGESQTMTTYALTMAELLHAQDVHLSPLDDLSPPLETWLKNGEHIKLMRSIPVQILANGQLRSLYSAERVPSSLLLDAGAKCAKWRSGAFKWSGYRSLPALPCKCQIGISSNYPNGHIFSDIRWNKI